MKRRGIAFTLAALVWAAPGHPVGPGGLGPPAAHGAPAPRQESAVDSTWRAARTALNAGEYRRAADLFREVERGGGDTALAADALYYRALALSRLGGRSNLGEALRDLERQMERYPSAATRGDASALHTRISGELARLGDADAAQAVAREARRIEESTRQIEESTQAVERAAQAADEAALAMERAERYSQEEDDVRVAALNALLQMDAVRAVPILRQVLARRDAGSEELRRHAVFLVSQKPTPETVDILLDAARNDPSDDVREEAVFWLSQTGDERAVEALEEILRSPGEAKLHENALFALSQLGTPRAGEILRDFALRSDVDPDLRENAIFWLGQAGDENAGFLRELYTSVEDEEVKKGVLFSVSQLGGPENARWLLDIAVDEGQPVEVRKEALFWAGQSGVEFAELGGLYDRLQSHEMRQQLIFVLSQREEPAAVERLIEIARSETDVELRSEAIFWLGQSEDPRVEELLLEIVTR